MVLSITRFCWPKSHRGFIDQGTHPRPAGRLCHELTGSILHLPPPPVTFTLHSPREQEEARTVALHNLRPIGVRGHSTRRAGANRKEPAQPVLTAWAQLVLSQGSWATRRTRWLPLALLAVPPAGRLETIPRQC